MIEMDIISMNLYDNDIKMSKQDREKLIVELTTKWYNEQEISSILEWLKDVEKWDVFTSEEVYRSLLAKAHIYA